MIRPQFGKSRKNLNISSIYLRNFPLAGFQRSYILRMHGLRTGNGSPPNIHLDTNMEKPVISGWAALTGGPGGCIRTISEQNLVGRASSVDDSEVFALFYLDCRSRGLRPKTLEGYAQRLAILRDLARFNGKSVLEVEKREIRTYIFSIVDRLSPETVNGRLRVWKVFYNWVVREALLDHAPTEDIHMMKTDQHRPEVLTTEQLELFFRSWDRRTYEGIRNRNLSLVLLDAMLRVGETLALNIEDLDVTAGVLHVSHTKGRRDRLVPINFRTAKSLFKFLRTERREVPGDLIFCQRDGKALNPGRIAQAFNRQSKRAKIHVYPHLLRHTGATIAANKGMPVHLLQRVLGHSDIRTTAVYLNPDGEEIKRQHDLFSPINDLKL